MSDNGDILATPYTKAIEIIDITHEVISVLHKQIEKYGRKYYFSERSIHFREKKLIVNILISHKYEITITFIIDFADDVKLRLYYNEFDNLKCMQCLENGKMLVNMTNFNRVRKNKLKSTILIEESNSKYFDGPLLIDSYINIAKHIESLLSPLSF